MLAHTDVCSQQKVILKLAVPLDTDLLRSPSWLSLAHACVWHVCSLALSRLLKLKLDMKFLGEEGEGSHLGV